MLAFGYELRKQDKKNNHTSDLIVGIVKPQILVDIIQSNYWDEGEVRMKCDLKKKFRLEIADSKSPLVYLKNHFKNFDEKPIIKKNGLEASKYTDELHLLLV